ncbi:unnamed protein product [Candida verbasci]|uniref:Mitochondrial intermembrane space import and assembly protein 40 n=1 Tax=Candida verbasci TaxID=1227364 RepID=A0A9W4TV51_9ASCO|nr:unnamed protein product [Candida verbasci]
MYRNLIRNNLRQSIINRPSSIRSIRQLSQTTSTKKSYSKSSLLIGSLVPTIIIYNYLTSSEAIRNDQETKEFKYQSTSTANLIEDRISEANEEAATAMKGFERKQEQLKGETKGEEGGAASNANTGSNTSSTASEVRTKDSAAKQAADESQENKTTRKPTKGTRKDKQVYEQDENKPQPTEDSKDSGEEKQEAAFNPETGEINWDCPCLGGMAHGPCGEEFKEAFSCFVFSETEPKGIDCIKKFENMRSCFKKHPDHYKEELYDDEKELATEDVENNVLKETDEAVKEIVSNK